jgi:hypothetical protein
MATRGDLTLRRPQDGRAASRPHSRPPTRSANRRTSAGWPTTTGAAGRARESEEPSGRKKAPGQASHANPSSLTTDVAQHLECSRCRIDCLDSAHLRDRLRFPTRRFLVPRSSFLVPRSSRPFCSPRRSRPSDRCRVSVGRPRGGRPRTLNAPRPAASGASSRGAACRPAWTTDRVEANALIRHARSTDLGVPPGSNPIPRARPRRGPPEVARRARPRLPK